MSTETHIKKIEYSGLPLAQAGKAMVMLHGRGATAADILSLEQYLNLADMALLAPQASNHTWYPYSFLAKPEENEPWLSSALALVNSIIADIKAQGIPANQVYLLGFSQGACLALEYAARNAGKYGGIIAFTGGLIGDKIYPENYTGNFDNTPVYIGSSDTDPHVPLNRVYATANILKDLGAVIETAIFPNMAHTINSDEIKAADRLLRSQPKK